MSVFSALHEMNYLWFAVMNTGILYGNDYSVALSFSLLPHENNLTIS